MMVMYGTLTGKSLKTLSLNRNSCISNCLNDKECIAASWTPNNNCQIHEIVLGYKESDQPISIEKLTAYQQNIVAVKTSVPSNTCPPLNTAINGSVTVNPRMNVLNLTYSWKKTESGWTMSQCSSIVSSRKADMHLCVKLYKSEQFNKALTGGFTQSEAAKYCGSVNRKLLGTTGPGELNFLRKSTPVTESLTVFDSVTNKITTMDGFSFWLGGTSRNCVNGECGKIPWTDGWSLTMVAVIKSTVTNPCIAVVNGEMVGRSCNEKMKGALCGWKFT